MTYKEPKREYGLLLDGAMSYGTEYVVARIVSREEGAEHPLGVSDSFSTYDRPKHLHGLTLDGLAMRGHIYWPRDSSDPYLIGNDPFYFDVHAVSSTLAKGMVKALDRITKRMRKDEAREPGDMLMSFAKALKLSFVVERVGPSRGSSFADNKWHWMTITEGRNRYRAMIAKAVEDAKAKGKAA